MPEGTLQHCQREAEERAQRRQLDVRAELRTELQILRDDVKA